MATKVNVGDRMRRLAKEAQSIAGDAYRVSGYDLFQALLTDKILVEVSA